MGKRRIVPAVVATVAIVATIVATVLLAQQGSDLPGTPLTPDASPTTLVATDPSATDASSGATVALPAARTVEVVQVVGAGDVGAELAVIYNGADLIYLAGWTLSGSEGNAFVFPELTLYPGGEVRVRSASGDSSPATLFWGRTRPAWESGELITLTNVEGDIIDTYVVP